MYQSSRHKEELPSWSYSVVFEKRYNIDLGEYFTYGIRASAGNTTMLHDVSVCRETVVWMSELFNQHQLSPVHLREAVEDMLVITD